MAETSVEYGPPSPFDSQERSISGDFSFDFEFGEPDTFGAEFINEVKERAKPWLDQNEPRAYMYALVQTGQRLMDDGSYWPGRSNFVDGILMAAAALNESEGGDAILARLIQSLPVPPTAEAA